MTRVIILLCSFIFHFGIAFSIPNIDDANLIKVNFGDWVDICDSYSSPFLPSGQSVVEFKTPLKKHSIDLSIEQNVLRSNLSIKLYDELEGMLVWNDNISTAENEYKISWANLLPDKTYFLVFESQYEKDFTLNLEYHALGFPPNDLCENAEILFGGEIYCDAIHQVFEDICATPDPEATGNCVDPTDPARWYTFTTPDPLPFNNFWFGYSPAAFEIFSTTSDCSGLVYEDCGGLLAFHPEPGTTYYFLVGTNMTITVPDSDINIGCTSPLTWFDMGPGISEGWGSTSCQDPSSLMPCQNDHVVWYSYETGCESSDITLQVEEYTTNLDFGPAEDLSITVILDDCSTLMSDYDVNGQGYLCDAISSGNILSLEDVPPGTSFVIGIGSESNEVGNYWLTVNEMNSGSVDNDFCDDFIELFDGENTGLSNLCASSDIDIPTCFGQSNNTVWFQYDAGPDPVDLELNILPGDISNAAIAALDGCSGAFIGQDCNGSLFLGCISGLLTIEVGSSSSNAGSFDLDISSSPAFNPPVPIYTGLSICSGNNASLNISFPGGEIVDLTVSVSPSSSSSINGMTSQQFDGVNSVDITEVLTNSASASETAIYSIIVGGSDFTCPSTPIEASFEVFPEFILVPTSFEGCAPYNLLLSAADVIQGGGAPFTSYQWIWNGFELIDDDEFIDYDFTDSGLLTLEVVDANNCTTFNDITLTIDEELQASFDFPLLYCRSQHETISLPTTSLEGVEGNWTPSIVELALYPDGFIDLNFEPLDPICNLGVSYQIEVYSGDEVEFYLPSIICSNEDLYEFPTTSANGLVGFWDIPEIYLSSISGPTTNVFTVSSAGCYEVYEYQFEPGDNFDINFDIPEAFCLNSDEFILPNISTEGFTGTWSTELFTQGNISFNTFTSTWTPDPGQSDCLGEFVLEYDIPPIIQPMFDLPTELCQSDPVFILPIMTFDQSEEGSWNIQEINPSQMSGLLMLQFIPDNTDCVAIFETSINIIPSSTPFFAINNTLCVLEEIITLPSISENNIQGTWSLPEIDPSLYPDQQIQSTFIPDPNLLCTEGTMINFQIQDAIIPTWSINNILCADSEDLVLPTVSNNGVPGNWTIPIIQVEENLGQVIVTEFLPDDICAHPSSITFEILNNYGVSAVGTDPSSCDTENGVIQLNTSSADLEYSIDGGLSWQSNLIFNQLAAGFYNIIIRSHINSSCIEIIDISLSANEAPMIDLLMIENITSCLDQTGGIIIEASGINLSFTIDEGLNWQNFGTFENLDPGDYTIEITQDGSTDCALEIMASIDEIIETEIIQVNTDMLSDCGAIDGAIEIIALGQNLQYSIDNGNNFTDSNVFENLDAGDYSIVVQSQDIEDCLATQSTSIEAPNAPMFIDVVGNDPTDCSPSNGEIVVSAIGQNLQYSIDEGLSWQSESLFINLSEGIYTILVHDELNTSCTDEIDYALIQVFESLDEPQLFINPMSDCDANDASLTVITTNDDLEFSMDNGTTWQIIKTFDDLSSGTYTLLVRDINALECTASVNFEIDNPDCPCNDLQLQFSINNTQCDDTESPYVQIVSLVGHDGSDLQIIWEGGETTNFITGVDDGWYFLTVYYDESCEWRDSVYVNVEDPITFDWSVTDSDCDQANNGVIEIFNILGGNGEYQINIDGDGLQQEATFSNLSEGSYLIAVNDTNGCSTEEQINVESFTNLEIILPEVLVSISDQSIILDPQIQESNIDSFLWISTGDFLNPGELIAEVSPEITTSYLLEIYYGQCIETHEILIEVLAEESAPDIFVNNVITPNDETNNILFAQAKSNNQLKINSLSVFDRWGNLLYFSDQLEINNSAHGWNGIHRAEYVNPGVYVYKVDYKNNGIDLIKIGTVTVLD